MKFFKLVLAFAGLCVSGLEVASFKNRSVPAKASGNHTAAQTADEVHELHSKLEKMATGLEAMSSQIAKSKIGPELKTFVKELRFVLAETKSMNNEAALRKLQAARAGVSQLTSDLTKRQVDIMKDEESQKNSLLLGVLMTRQKEPMADQLKILRSDDFAMLPVSKALLAKHNESAPFFGQAAAYLDTHATKGIKVRAVSEAERKAEQAKMAARLQRSVDSMQKIFDARAKHEAEREKELATDLQKASTNKRRHVLQAIKKREQRSFKKWAVLQQHDIEAMKEAVAAVKKGDVSAVNKAKDALQRSMQALKDKNAGFLVLLSLGHRLLERDCPYCAAQCVGTCHEAGKPYTQCLTDCADAGKGL